MVVYTLFTLPHGFRFSQLTRKEARGNFQVFVDRIPERLRLLEGAVRSQLPSWNADFCDDSLPSLGEWYASHVEERRVTNDELALLRRQSGPALAFTADFHIE